MSKNFDGYLRKKGIYVSSDWLSAAEKHIRTQGKKVVKSEDVLELFLYSDLRDCGIGCVPTDISSKHNYTLSGSFVLQVNQIFNAGESYEHRFEETSSRMLKLALTDGKQTFQGFEYRRLPSISVNSKPGLKVRVNNVQIRRGLLLLQPSNADILGGSVLSLCKEHEKHLKSRASKRDANLMLDDLEPPPKKKTAYPTFTGAKAGGKPQEQTSPTRILPARVITDYVHKEPKAIQAINLGDSGEVVDLVDDDSPRDQTIRLPKTPTWNTPVQSSSFLEELDDGLDDELDDFLADVEGSYVPQSTVTPLNGKKEKLEHPTVEMEFLIDQMGSVPSTVRVKGAIIKTRNDYTHEDGLLTFATIDDGTKQMEAILSEKVKKALQQRGELTSLMNLEGVMTLSFPAIGAPLLEEVTPVNACHIRSLLGQVKSHFGW